jgi:transposase InsO family protein
MGIDSHLSTCVGTQSPKYLEMAQGHISLSTVDNGKQFDNQYFKDFCFSIGTKLAFASVYHPQSNEVVERANGKIFTVVKKMLLDEKRANGPICYLRQSGH